MSIVAKQLDQDATWYGGRPRGLGDIVLDWDPAAPMEMGTAAPTFRPMSIVVKWLPISATADLLFQIGVFPQISA